MPFEKRISIRESIYWKSAYRKTSKSVQGLLDELRYLRHLVQQYSPHGPSRGPHPFFGFRKLQYLVERGVMKPLVVPINEYGDDDRWQVTSAADLDTAIAELEQVLADYPTASETKREPL
jgi:hypothetical protein